MDGGAVYIDACGSDFHDISKRRLEDSDESSLISYNGEGRASVLTYNEDFHGLQLVENSGYFSVCGSTTTYSEERRNNSTFIFIKGSNKSVQTTIQWKKSTLYEASADVRGKPSSCSYTGGIERISLGDSDGQECHDSAYGCAEEGDFEGAICVKKAAKGNKYVVGFYSKEEGIHTDAINDSVSPKLCRESKTTPTCAQISLRVVEQQEGFSGGKLKKQKGRLEYQKRQGFNPFILCVFLAFLHGSDSDLSAAVATARLCSFLVLLCSLYGQRSGEDGSNLPFDRGRTVNEEVKLWRNYISDEGSDIQRFIMRVQISARDTHPDGIKYRRDTSGSTVPSVLLLNPITVEIETLNHTIRERIRDHVLSTSIPIHSTHIFNEITVAKTIIYGKITVNISSFNPIRCTGLFPTDHSGRRLCMEDGTNRTTDSSLLLTHDGYSANAEIYGYSSGDNGSREIIRSTEYASLHAGNHSWCDKHFSLFRSSDYKTLQKGKCYAPSSSDLYEEFPCDVTNISNSRSSNWSTVLNQTRKVQRESPVVQIVASLS